MAGVHRGPSGLPVHGRARRTRSPQPGDGHVCAGAASLDHPPHTGRTRVHHGGHRSSRERARGDDLAALRRARGGHPASAPASEPASAVGTSRIPVLPLVSGRKRRTLARDLASELVLRLHPSPCPAGRPLPGLPPRPPPALPPPTGNTPSGTMLQRRPRQRTTASSLPPPPDRSPGHRDRCRRGAGRGPTPHRHRPHHAGPSGALAAVRARRRVVERGPA